MLAFGYYGESQPTEQFVPAWPNHPEKMTTLLAAAGVAGTFLGLGTLTGQRWVTWLGLVVAAAILVSHIVRHRRTDAHRAATCELLNVRLMSRCERRGGPTFMQTYYGRTEPVVLALSDMGLHICRGEALQILTTLPLYDIEAVGAGPIEQSVWQTDFVAEPLADEGDVLNLAVRMSGDKLHCFTFTHFERHAPPALWADAIRHSIPQRAA
jgi:hypothetical protein